MNETQKNKMQVLEWINGSTLSSSGTLEDKVRAAKDLYEFVFGDEVQAVPEEKESDPDCIVGVAGEKIMANQACVVVPSEMITDKGSDTSVTEATEKESDGSGQDQVIGDPPVVTWKSGTTEEDKCNHPTVEKLGCPKCEKPFYIEKHYIETHSINCPFCKSDEVMWGLV